MVAHEELQCVTDQLQHDCNKAKIITLTIDLLLDQGDLPREVVVVHTRRDRPETAAALARLQEDLPENYADVAYEDWRTDCFVPPP